MDLSSKNNTNRKESDTEYTEMMKAHMEEKYSISFDVIDSIFPEGGFNSGMKQNIVSLKDPDGICCNVKADLNSPYDYYDDYVECITASRIERELYLSNLEGVNARVYVTVRNKAADEILSSPENVLSLTLVGALYRSPDDKDLQGLYDLYEAIQNRGYRNIYFIIGFVNDSDEFNKAINNYRVYGKSQWSDYKGSFYANLTVKTPDLSFEEFKSCIVKQ